jgi:signal transduction histidine kinase/ActR/RegA family two-component response regulator
MFVASLVAGFWSAREFGAVAVWLSNGIMAAALLQLHRRDAVAVIAACFAANLLNNVVRGDPGVFLWINALLNLGMAALAALLARRFCGAALDMRRPSRLLRFTVMAALPAVLLSAAAAIGLMSLLMPLPAAILAFYVQTYVSVEFLGVMLVTPALLMLARAHRFRGVTRASKREAAALIALSVAVTILTFTQAAAPVLFLVLMPLVLIALRLSPTTTAAIVLVTAAICGTLTLTGQGPVHLTQLSDDPALAGSSPMLRRLLILNVFLVCAVITILPISTVVTERRRLEARLRTRTQAAQEARLRAEHAAEARGRFLALMSHEMRTPLNGVAGFADLLATRPGLDAEAVRQARQIRQSSDGLLMLVEDVLDFARGGAALSPEPVELETVVRDAASASLGALEAKRLEFRVEARLAPGARHFADRRALRQTLHALISNAAKFTERGHVEVRIEERGGQIVIRVADTGPGVDPDHRDRLFGAFEQIDDSLSRAHQGAGLGLALVARNVRRMDGRVDVGDRPGGGAAFTLTLPLPRAGDMPGPAHEPADAAPPPDEGGRAPRVLVVDDHPVNREVARVMLEAFGCEVTEAVDGLEAVSRAQAQAFDLILMDVRMPRMDGIEATRRLRADLSEAPIVAMTADAMPEDVARCLGAGMDAHMAKPISQHGLLTVLNRALSGEFAATRPDAVAA